MSFSNAFETTVLTWAFTASAATRPSTWFIALYTVAPGETGGGTEISTSGTGYARQSVSFTVTGDTASNTANVEWSAATSAWGSVVAVGVFDASTAGNLIAYASLTTARTVNSGDVFRILAGDLDITLN
jgi:hypothetical protein